MSTWIKVEDRLPDFGSAVIAYISDRQTVILTHYYDDFALIRCGPEDGFSDHGVTHWMPLPEPPQDQWPPISVY